MSAEPEFTAEELVQDGSQPRRMLGNALACIWDIDDGELTARERSRLSTIQSKIQDLDGIIEDREVAAITEESKQ